MALRAFISTSNLVQNKILLLAFSATTLDLFIEDQQSYQINHKLDK